MKDPNIKNNFDRLAKLTCLILSLNDTSATQMTKVVEQGGDTYKVVLTADKVVKRGPDGSAACLSGM